MDAMGVIFIGGFYLFACAVKFIMDPKALPKIMEAVIKNEAIAVISAILPLLMGLILVVAFGPSYESSRADALVGIMGLFLISNGLFRLWAKKTWHSMVKKMKDRSAPHVSMWLLLAMGITLMLVGLGVVPLG